MERLRRRLTSTLNLSNPLISSSISVITVLKQTPFRFYQRMMTNSDLSQQMVMEHFMVLYKETLGMLCKRFKYSYQRSMEEEDSHQFVLQELEKKRDIIISERQLNFVHSISLLTISQMLSVQSWPDLPTSRMS